jgi:hypothetical protein
MFKERVLKEGPWYEGDANSMWMKMSTCIRKMVSEEFRVIKGGKRETNETWWWNEKVQQNVIKEKKECFRRMHRDRSVDNVERYKVAKKVAKRAMNEARDQMYDGLYQRLGTKEGEKDIYRMDKSRGRRGASSK